MDPPAADHTPQRVLVRDDRDGSERLAREPRDDRVPRLVVCDAGDFHATPSIGSSAPPPAMSASSSRGMCAATAAGRLSFRTSAFGIGMYAISMLRQALPLSASKLRSRTASPVSFSGTPTVLLAVAVRVIDEKTGAFAVVDVFDRVMRCSR